MELTSSQWAKTSPIITWCVYLSKPKNRLQINSDCAYIPRKHKQNVVIESKSMWNEVLPSIEWTGSTSDFNASAKVMRWESGGHNETFMVGIQQVWMGGTRNVWEVGGKN